MDAFWKSLSDDDETHRLYQNIIEVAHSFGFTRIEENRTDQVQGYNQGKLIAVKSSLDATSKVNTFIHELTHGLLEHGKTELTKQEDELEAEAAPYIVAVHFGIENLLSIAYLQMYGNDEKSLAARLDSIRKAVHDSIEPVEKALGKNISVEAVAA